MEITVTKVVVAHDGLRLAMKLEYFKGGPIRFFQGLIPWGLFSGEVLDGLMLAQIRLTDRWLDEEPKDEPLPGLG